MMGWPGATGSPSSTSHSTIVPPCGATTGCSSWEVTKVATVAPGATVATLVTSRDEHPVVAPHGGTIVEWLVEDGDPVAPGQPIIRLHPEAV